VRLTKSAALTTSPLALTLTPFFHQQLAPPTSGAGGMVAVGPLEGEVVGEDVGAAVEFDVFFAVIPRSVVGKCDAARIPVVGAAVLLVPEGDRAADGVIDRDVLAAEFEAVAVAVGGLRRRSTASRCCRRRNSR
jgi:hypothetical protein